MPDNIIQAILVQGGLGTTAAVFMWLYIQERKDRKEAEKALILQLSQSISDKIADRENVQQVTKFAEEAIKLLKESNRNV